MISRVLRQVSSGSSAGYGQEDEDEPEVYRVLRSRIQDQDIRALDVVSALLPPIWFTNNRTLIETDSVRKFSGYMKKKCQRIWRRRWIQVELERNGSSSKVSICHNAETIATNQLVLYRGEDGAIEHFGPVLFIGSSVAEFEIRGIRLRSIPGTTPYTLIAALAALSWPPSPIENELQHSEHFSIDTLQVSTTEESNIDYQRMNVQALLLALGDVGRAQQLINDTNSRRRMKEEDEAITHFGVIMVANDRPLLELEGGPLAPPGVAPGACFMVPGGCSPSPRPIQRDTRFPSPQTNNEMDALIECAVASRVIDDFSARRIRLLNTNSFSPEDQQRTERVRILLNQRLNELDASFVGSGASLADDDNDSFDHYSFGDDNNLEIDLGQNIRIRHRGRWLDSCLVAADDQWLTVRFRDGAGDFMNRRLRRQSSLQLPKRVIHQSLNNEEQNFERPSTKSSNATKSGVVRRCYRRELLSRGNLSWASIDEDEEIINNIPEAQTCIAVVPDGVRNGARLMVRVPGYTEPCVVIVPREAQPGSKIKFKFFPIENGDGSQSCIRWPGFPHSELSKAPEWRRLRLDARLAKIRISSDSLSRNERVKPLFIDRNKFLESTLAAIPPRGNKWHQLWTIRFVGEPGLDASGLSREFWTIVSTTLFRPDLGLFRFASTDNLTYEISTLAFSMYGQRAAAKLYRTAGRMLAKAFLDKYLISAPLSRPLLKHLLALPVTFDDLAFVDASLYANLHWLLACDDEKYDSEETKEDVVELLCLNFTVAEEHLGAIREIELKPNGHNINVTLKNRQEYVELRFKYAMLHRIEAALSPFLRGFYDIVPIATLTGQRNSPEQLDAQELELIMFGTTNIDLDDWQRYTVYRNLSVNDPRCLFFWKIVTSDFDDHQRMRLLQFVTGTARLPAGGFKYLQGTAGVICHFELSAIDGGDLALPRAHTCFNRLDLPDYSSYEKMRQILTNIIAVDVQGFSEV